MRIWEQNHGALVIDADSESGLLGSIFRYDQRYGMMELAGGENQHGSCSESFDDWSHSFTDEQRYLSSCSTMFYS